jgi:uncharacterized cupredoxin-like copper-binding protein
MIRLSRSMTLAVAGAALVVAAGLVTRGYAHDDHPHGAGAHGDNDAHFSAGVPGDPSKPSRTVFVTMAEDGKKMMFRPAVITVRRNEQIRFVLGNDGVENHEFILATKVENRKHGELMKKFPEMEHDDPNGKRLAPYSNNEILWKFTKTGEFEYACLIPGHYDAGMFGKVVVK